jgi:hypothetical protein
VQRFQVRSADAFETTAYHEGAVGKTGDEELPLIYLVPLDKARSAAPAAVVAVSQPRNGAPWTSEQDNILIELMAADAPLEDIATTLNRTRSAIEARWTKIRSDASRRLK